MNYQDVRSDQPPARGTPSTASGRPLTHDHAACAALHAALHACDRPVITGVALTVRQLGGMEREGEHGSRLDKVVSNSDSVLYARWGACLHDPRQQRQLIKGLKRLRFTP